MVLVARGVLLRNGGKPKEALPLMLQAIPVLSRSMGPADHRVLHIRSNAAIAAQEAGYTAEAERLWAEGVRDVERMLGSNNPAIAQFLKGQAYTLLEQNCWPEAIKCLKQALPVYHRNLPTNHNNTLDAEDLLARAYEQKGDIDKAAVIYRRTLPLWMEYLPYPRALDHCEIIASFFQRYGHDEEARHIMAALQLFQPASAATNSPAAPPAPLEPPASRP